MTKRLIAGHRPGQVSCPRREPRALQWRLPLPSGFSASQTFNRPGSSCASWSKPYAGRSGRSAPPVSTAGDAASALSSEACISPPWGRPCALATSFGTAPPPACPRIPTAGPAQVNRRARKIPATLWPSWAVRLSPPDGAYPRILAPVLSSAVLLVGNPMDLDEVATRLGSVTDGRTISRLLQLLADDPHWDAIAAAVTRLAAYLDDNDVPIDYQRRRRLDYSDLLPPRQWLDLCRRTGMPPGRGRRDKMARCHAVRAHQRASRRGRTRFRYRRRRSLLPRRNSPLRRFRTPELAAALDETARDFLARHRVRGEPVTWQPPMSLLRDLDLPGPDPSLIDVARLHELVREGAHPVQRPPR